MPDSKRILCFGDSLTWGWVPVAEGELSRRYPFEERWTGVMAGALGDGYEIVEEGLSGRTTSADDPLDPRLNGSRYLPSALASHLPLDLVVIMLGTNDTKAHFARTPYDIAMGMAVLLSQAAQSAGGVGTGYPAPRALVVAPPALGELTGPWRGEVFKGGKEKSARLAVLYRALADASGAAFADAGEFITTDGKDGVHFTPENNEDLGRALAGVVSSLL
ncbi:SGNH/GDSL hydrolase family protein [Streptomyces sp. NPDC057654]|uniref:SGNH/GDSL hydrolase family protein n=1 Tax=Streptomyces sp. NPDC057654 TaxID=3346196 RepID=UPI003673CFDC